MQTIRKKFFRYTVFCTIPPSRLDIFCVRDICVHANCFHKASDLRKYPVKQKHIQNLHMYIKLRKILK